MSTGKWTDVRIPPRKLAILTVAIALIFPLFLVDWFWIRKRIPLWLFWRTELILLITLEIAYGLSLLLAGVAIPVLGFRYFGGRRQGLERPGAARGLLCATSVLIGLLAAEAVIAVRQHESQSATVVPVTGQPSDAVESPPWRFPVASGKIGLPTQFSEKPTEGGIDLVVMGESSAEGVPFRDWLSIGAIVKWQLEKAIPGLDIRLTILARSGDTLEKQHQALAGLKRRPELVIVYCGHNEFLSRFFASGDPPYYFLDQSPSAWDRFVDKAERLSPVCGLIRESADQCRIALPPPEFTRELVDVPVYTTDEYSQLLVEFRRQLEEIVSYSVELGALPILISPPGNDADYEPNRSYLPAGTPRGERESFHRAFLETRRLEGVDPAKSISQYRELLARQPCFAETHYRLAMLLRKAGAWDEAYRHFVEARDRDGYPMRCLTSFQDVYRELAARHDCVFIDGQAYFHAIGRNGLLDDELFQDAMHPSLRGQIALAQAVVCALHARRILGWAADSAPPLIDPADCAAHFGLGRESWKNTALWAKGFYSLVGRLRYDSGERSRRIDAAIAAADQIDAGTAPEAVGIVNLGIPAPVPLISGEGQRARITERQSQVSPCLEKARRPVNHLWFRGNAWRRKRVSKGKWRNPRIEPRTLAIFTAVLELLVPLFFVDWIGIPRRIPHGVSWQTKLNLLIALEIAYGVALLVTGLAIPVLGFRYLRGRRRRVERPWAARGLLCATSVLIGLLAAEAVISVRQYRAHRTTVLPAIGELEDARKSADWRLPVASGKIELPTQFSDDRTDRGIDLVVLGESSAEGVPFQRWLSIGAIVKWQLETAIPGLDIRLKVLANSGDTLEKQRKALAGLKRRPELVIVYCGHNEFFSRFSAFRDLPHYFVDQKKPRSWDRFVEQAERLSPLCGLIRESADQCRIAMPPPPRNRELVDAPVFSPDEYLQILADFRRCLEEIVSYVEGLGALAILISPPGNDADFEPNRSYLPADTSAAVERESFSRAFLEARLLEEIDPAQCIRQYGELLVRQPCFAETHYRLAMLLRKTGDRDGAYRHFMAARDLDGHPARCLTPFQEAYRDVASRHDCVFIDGQSYFHAIGRNGLLDDELFQDAMHPSLRGQIALAQAVLCALHARRVWGWAENPGPPVIDPALCAAHFGLDREGWRFVAIWTTGFYKLVSPLRYDSSLSANPPVRRGHVDRGKDESGDRPRGGSGLVNMGIPRARFR